MTVDDAREALSRARARLIGAEATGTPSRVLAAQRAVERAESDLVTAEAADA
jgi:hypothetical protein